MKTLYGRYLHELEQMCYFVSYCFCISICYHEICVKFILYVFI